MSAPSARRLPIRKGRAPLFSVAVALIAGLAAPSVSLAADTQAPKLVSASAAPSSVNVTGGPAAVTVTFRLTDDDSGVVLPVVSGDSDLSRETTPPGTVTRVSGDAKDGVYQAKIIVGKGAVGGGWTAFAAKLTDAAGNASPGAVKLATFSVFAFGFDTVAPKLVSAALSTNAIDVTSAPQTVTVTLRVTDDYSGAMGPVIDVVSPDGKEVKTVGTAMRTSGDPQDGTYGLAIVVPKGVQAGSWTVVLRPLRDYTGNAERSSHELGKIAVTSSTVAATPTPNPTPTPTPAAKPTPAAGGAPGVAATPAPADQGGVLGSRANSKGVLSFAGKSKKQKITAKGTLSIALKCMSVSATCRGSVRLYGKVRGKKIKVVSKRVSVKAGKTTKVSFTLTRKGRSAIKRGKGLKLSASVWTDGTKAPRTRSLSAKRAK